MAAAGHSDNTKIWVEDIFSMSAAGNPIVYNQTNHHISSFVAAVGYIFGYALLPSPVAIDSIPRLTSITTLVLAGA